MTTRIFVPRDTTAISLGADQIATLIQAEAASRGLDIEIVRNGTRGLFWLEPLIEVETNEGRLGFGPVTESDVSTLFNEHFYHGNQSHPSCVGLVEEIPYLKNSNVLPLPVQALLIPFHLTITPPTTVTKVWKMR